MTNLPDAGTWYVRESVNMGEDDRETDRRFASFKLAVEWVQTQVAPAVRAGCDVRFHFDGFADDPDFRYVSVYSPPGERWGPVDCDGCAGDRIATHYLYPERLWEADEDILLIQNP